MPTSDSPTSAPCFAPVATANATTALAALINRLKSALSGSSGWTVPNNWSLGHVPASTDALLLDHTFLNPMVSSELAGDFTIETLCFDTGADSYTIQANLGNGTFRYLTFLGGTNALGGAEAIALSPTTTGTIDIGGIGQHGGLFFVFGNVPIAIVVPNAAATLKFDAAADMSGSSGLTKMGAGTLHLAGSNNYTGPTVVNAGTLIVGSLQKGGVISSIGMSSSAAANLVLNGVTLRYESNFTDPQTDRLFTLGASGATIDASGQRSLTFANPGPIAFANSNTPCQLTLAGTGVGTLTPALGNNGSAVVSLTKTGTGTWNLSGAQTYTGPTQINGGTLQLTGTIYGVSGPGAIQVGNGGTFVLTRSDSFGIHNVTPQSTVTIESGGVVSNGGPYFTTFNNLTINGGELRANGGTSPVYPAYQLKGTVTVGGTGASLFTSTGSVNSFTGIQLGNNTTGGTTTFNVVDAGASLIVAPALVDGCNRENTGLVASGLVKIGAGELAMQAANTYSGSTTISGGALVIGLLPNGGAASGVGRSSNAAGNLLLDGGTLEYTGPVASTDRLFTVGNAGGTIAAEGGALSFTNAGAIALAGTAPLRTLTLGGFSGSGSIASFLTDSGACKLALAKEGTSTWTLTNANGYTGGTTINGGTLVANHPGFPSHRGAFAPGSTVTVNRTGTLHCVGTDALGFYEGYANLVIQGGVVTTDASMGNHTTLQNVVMTGGTITSPSRDHHFFLNGTLTTNADANAAVINCPQFELGTGWPTAGSAVITVAQGTASDGIDLRIDSQVYHHALVKNGPGTLQLTNAGNFYDEGTTINAGVVSILSLANGGGNSSLGRSANAAANLVLNGGTLQYAGTSNGSTDRLFTLGPNNGTLEVAGSGSATFAGNTTGGSNNAIAFSTPGVAQSLTLTGTGVGTFGASLGNNGSASTGLIKNGSGTWILNGANRYTGATTINEGTLALDNGTGTVVLPAGAVINVVNGTLRLQGATYDAIQTPVLTVSTGGKVDAAGSTKNAHTLGQTLLLGGKLTNSTPPDPMWGNFVLDNTATLTASGDVPSLIDAQVLQVGANSTIQVATGTNGAPSQLTISSQIQNYRSTDANPVRKSGPGTLVLAGMSNHTGPTIMGGGIINTTTLANGGSPSNLGASPNTADRLVLDGGTWQYTGPAVSIDRLFTLGAAGGVIEVANATNLTLANAGAIACTGTAVARTLTLSGAATGALAAQIGDGSGGPTGVTKTGTGAWKLTGASTYSGVTAVRSGVLVASSVANGGVASALGAASNAARNLVLDGGVLMFMTTGGATATDRLFSVGPNGGQLGVAGGAVNFLGNGAGPANAIGFTTPNTPATLRLFGGPATLGAALGDNGSGTTSLIKDAQGTWTLAGSNTYTGTTTISGGTLVIFVPQGCPDYLVTSTTPGGPSMAMAATPTGSQAQPAANQAMLAAPYFFGTLTLGADNVLASNATVTINGGGVFDAGSYHCTIAKVTLNRGTVTSSTGAVAATGIFDLQYGNVSATLAGPALLTKSTAALVTLTGANTYTGGTNLNGGTLAIGSAGALGTSGTISFAGGVLQFSAANTTDYSARFSNGAGELISLDTNGQAITLASDLASPGGSLTKLGAGTLTLSGANTYTGATNVNAGVVIVGAVNTVPAASAVIVNGGGIFRLGGISNAIGSLAGTGSVELGGAMLDTGNDGTDTTFSGTIVDTGGGILRKSGAGTFTMTGANTYTGGTQLQDGTLSLGNAGALGTTGLISFNGGALQFSAADTMDYSARFNPAAGQLYRIDTNGQYITLAAPLISAGGSLTKLGAGVLSLKGANSYTGGTNINGGTLCLGSSGALGVTGVISFGGGALQFTTANATDYSARFSTAAGQLYNFDTNGLSIQVNTALTSNGGSLTKSGLGTLALRKINSYTGPTTINAGALSMAVINALPTTSAVTINSGGTLVLGGASVIAGSISGNGAVNLGTGILTVGTDNSSTTFSGSISGTSTTCGLTKTGSGTLNLTNSNTYPGKTVINEGVVQVSILSSGGIGSGIGASTNAAANLVFNGGTLLYTGAGGVTDRLFTLGANGGTIDQEATYGSLLFSNTGAIAFAGANTSPTLNLVAGGNCYASLAATIRDNGTGRTSVMKSGEGVWALQAANNYSGPTIVNAGELSMKANAATCATSVTVNYPGSLRIQGAVSIGSLAGNGFVNAYSGTLTTGRDNTSTVFAGFLQTNNGTLTKVGTGTWTLAGQLADHQGGILNLNGGTVTVASGYTLSYSSGTILFSGGTLQFSVSDTNDYSRMFSSGPNQLYQVDTGYCDVVFGSGFGSAGGSFTKLGWGRLTLNADSTYTGATIVKGGILAVSHIENGGIPSSIGQSSNAAANLLLDGGVLEINFAGAVNTDRLLSLGLNGGTISANTAAGTVTFTHTGATGFNGTNNSPTLTLDAVANASGTFQPIIGNNGTGRTSVAKTGGGDWSLVGTNTYSGATTVSDGQLIVGNGNLPVASAVTVMQPGVLRLTAAAIATFGSLAGDGTVVVDNGNLTVGGNNLSSTFSGTLNLPGGWSLTKVGNGTFSLGAPLTVPGGIALNAGALGLAVAGALGATGQISFGGGTLQFSAADASDYSSRFSITGTQRYRFDTNGVDVTVAASLLCPSGSLVKLGAGALILHNFNSFSFGITLSGGFVELGHSLALGNNGGILFLGGGLRFTASNTTDYSARFSTASNQTFALDTNGFDITLATARSSGSSSLRKYGAGVLTLAAAFTYSGRTTILDGTLRLAAFTTLSSSTMISITPGAVFDMASYSATVGSLDGGGSVNMGSGTLDIGNDNASTGIFSGSMTGSSGALTKSGTGTQTFDGTSLTYDGPTVIARGTLAFTGATTSTISGTASVRVGGSTAATLAGMPSIVLADNGTFTVDNLGILNPGAGSATGLTINFPAGGAATVLFQAGCTVRFTLANSQGAGNAPVPADYTAINVGSAVGVNLDGAIDLVINASANVGDLFPIIVGAGNLAGVFANANIPAPNSGGSCYRFTAANGSVWDLNTAWTGTSPQAGVDATVFEQTTGGLTVALLRVS